MHIDQQEPDQAIDFARQAVAFQPHDAAAADALGWACYCAGQADLAQPQLTRAVSIDPQPAYRYHLGMLLESQGDKPEAARQYRQALESLPDNPTLALRETISARLAGLDQP
jgi:tetratricopeptide (TPR) repeat protein